MACSVRSCATAHSLPIATLTTTLKQILRCERCRVLQRMHLGMQTSGYLRLKHGTAMRYLSRGKQCHWGRPESEVPENLYTSGDAAGCAVLKASGRERVSRVVNSAAVTSVAPSDEYLSHKGQSVSLAVLRLSSRERDRALM